MSSAAIRIVQQHNITGMEVAGKIFQRATHPPRQRQNVARMIPRLRNHLSFRPKQGAGEVVELVDHRRIRGADDVGAHLAHNCDQALAYDFERDGIDYLDKILLMLVHDAIRSISMSP